MADYEVSYKIIVERPEARRISASDPEQALKMVKRFNRLKGYTTKEYSVRLINLGNNRYR